MNKKIMLSHIVAGILVSQFSLFAEGGGNATKLDEVLVTSAAGYEQSLIDAPASISVITKEELEGKAYYDLTDALRDIPGVSIEGGGGGGMGASNISIRGMDSDYTLLLIDGKPQGSSRQAFFNGGDSGQEAGWLPPLSAIERIEVIRGPMSSLYGSQALGGVINFITKKVVNEFTGSVSAQKVIQESSLSGDEQIYNYFLTGPIIKDKLGFSINGAYTKRDEDKIFELDRNGNLEQVGYRENIRKNINGKLNWIANENNDLAIEYGYSEQESNNPSEDTYNEVRRNIYGITHDYSWNESISTETYIQHEDVDNLLSFGGIEYLQSIFNSKTVIPFETNKMTVGVEYKEEEIDAGERARNVRVLKRWNGSLFVEDEYFVTNDFYVTAGARLNEDEKYGSELTPRVYGVYKVGENITIKGGVSGGYITPDLKKGDSNWIEGGGGGGRGADIGNDNVIPEKSTSYEIGLIYDNEENFNLSLTAYKTDFIDKIEKITICDRRTSSTTGDTECFYGDTGVDYEVIAQYNNVDEAELEGFEVSTNYKIQSVSLNANYTYSNSKITEDKRRPEDVGNPLNNYPKHTVNLGANWEANNSLKFWSKGKYRGETLEDGTSQVPAYTIVDAGVNYKVSKDFSLNMSISNLLDKQITDDEYDKILDGRKYAIGMRYDF